MLLGVTIEMVSLRPEFSFCLIGPEDILVSLTEVLTQTVILMFLVVLEHHLLLCRVTLIFLKDFLFTVIRIFVSSIILSRTFALVLHLFALCKSRFVCNRTRASCCLSSFTVECSHVLYVFVLLFVQMTCTFRQNLSHRIHLTNGGPFFFSEVLPDLKFLMISNWLWM